MREIINRTELSDYIEHTMVTHLLTFAAIVLYCDLIEREDHVCCVCVCVVPVNALSRNTTEHTCVCFWFNNKKKLLFIVMRSLFSLNSEFSITLR